MDHRTVTANGTEFAYIDAGPEDGPLALCLHGFPDTAHSWRYLLPRLAAVGFHAVAPFQRGYAPTPVPDDGRFDTGTLALDACGLHDALGGGEDSVIIGHDWGAFAAYGAAVLQPERWRRVVTSAVAPQGSMAEGFFTYDQLRRSWYVFFFQTPLAEYAVGLDDYAFIDRLWSDWSPGFDGSWDAARVKESLAEPASLTAAIDYYRAMFAGPPNDPQAAAPRGCRNDGPPADVVPPRSRRRLHRSRHHRPGDRLPGSRFGDGGRRGGRTLPACGAARPGQRSHPPLPHGVGSRRAGAGTEPSGRGGSARRTHRGHLRGGAGLPLRPTPPALPPPGCPPSARPARGRRANPPRWAPAGGGPARSGVRRPVGRVPDGRSPGSDSVGWRRRLSPALGPGRAGPMPPIGNVASPDTGRSGGVPGTQTSAPRSRRA